MLGATCNDEDLLPCAIHEVRDSLHIASGDHDGIGVGYYRNDDPLLMKKPCAKDCDIDYAELLDEVTSNVVLVHVRKGTVGAWKDINTHPFRFRRWLFAHVGHLSALEDHRQEVKEALPPFLARNIRGETDSELAFHLFLNVLYKEGKLNDLSLGAEQIAGYLKESIAEIDRFQARGAQQSLAIIVTGGQAMAAACRGVTMHYSHREGILECQRHK
jgi:glutamine amidotransferase